MTQLPPQRLYQDFLAVVRGIQYLGYTLGTILLLVSLFSGTTSTLLIGSISALLVVGAVYLSTQGVIAVVDLLSRIEVNTRGGGSLAPETPKDPDQPPLPIPGSPSFPPPELPPLPDPPPVPDFFSDPPLPPQPAVVPPQPLSLGLPVLFALAEVEKKYQVRMVPSEGEEGITLEVTLTQAAADHLAMIRELRDQLRQQQVTGKIAVRVLDPQGQVRWENKVSV